MTKKMTLIQFWRKASTVITVVAIIVCGVFFVGTLLSISADEHCVDADFGLSAAQLCGMDRLCVMNPYSYEKWMRDWTYIKENCPDEWEASKEFTPTTRTGKTNRGHNIRPRTENEGRWDHLLRIPPPPEPRYEPL